MRCDECRHDNPTRSRFCNQCGAPLTASEDATEELAPPQRAGRAPVAFGIPGSAEGRSVPVGGVLYPSIAAARGALMAVGAVPEPRLETRLQVPGVGEVARVFGVVGNHLAFDEATDAGTQLDMLAFQPADLVRFTAASNAVSQRVARVLKNPDNERIVARMRSGRVKYLPANRALAKHAEQDLAKVGLHLPWSVNGLDMAFASRCREALQGFGFVCFYGHLGRIEPADGGVVFRQTRMISVPFGVTGVHTWDMEIGDEVVDEDCALLIEANARPIKA